MSNEEAAAPNMEALKITEEGGGDPEVAGEGEEEVPGYKAPEPRALEKILQDDAEDEDMVKYKQKLLGSDVVGGAKVEPFPEDKRHVIVKRLVMVTEGRPDMVMDLDQGVEQVQKKKFVIKEGAEFYIRIEFYVQREIVVGLKYTQKTYKLKIPVDKMTHVCGSHGPKMELQTSTTKKPEMAPSGMVARGQYSITSLITDDDNTEHLKWDWTLEVKKDWEDSA